MSNMDLLRKSETNENRVFFLQGDENIDRIDRIYKANILNKNNQIESICVFQAGEAEEAEGLDNDLDRVFTKEEKEKIEKGKIKVTYVKDTIHLDDSIGVIKLKIKEVLKKDFSIEEIYLFCKKREKLYANQIYQRLSNNKRHPISKQVLQDFLSNIKTKDGNAMKFQIEDKPIYSYDDILALNLNEKTIKKTMTPMCCRQPHGRTLLHGATR
jgi:hypothetical protein